MTCGIYLISNRVNGKKYVGQSKHIEKRFKEHCNRDNGSLIHKAITKYGQHNFDFEILEECSEDITQLNKKEMYWIAKLNTTSKKCGYNLTKGGDNKDHLIGYSHTENSRNAISKSNSGKNNPMNKGKPVIHKNGHVNGKQQYRLQYNGKVIARSHSISKLEHIRDFEDWDNLHKPKVSLIKDGTTQGKQKWSIMYKSVILKTTCDLNKAKKYLKFAKNKLEGENKEYYSQNLDAVFPCRKYVHKSPDDLKGVPYRQMNPNSAKDKLSMSKILNSSGIYRVTYQETSNNWRYVYKDVLGKKVSLISRDPSSLKKKVLDNGLEWIVIDENKAISNGLI